MVGLNLCMQVDVEPPVSLGKRPKARWYLLAVLSAFAAVGCLVASVVTAVWQDKANLRLPEGQVKLTQSHRYDVYGQAGTGDRVVCDFTPLTGGAPFTETFVVPRPRHDHFPRHRHVFLRWTNQLGTFAAPQTGTDRMQCTATGASTSASAGTGKVIYSGATQEPYGYVNVLIWATVLLGAFTILWPMFVFTRRRRARPVTG